MIKFGFIYLFIGYFVGKFLNENSDTVQGPVFFLIVALTWPIWALAWLYYFIKYWREGD